GRVAVVTGGGLGGLLTQDQALARLADRGPEFISPRPGRHGPCFLSLAQGARSGSRAVLR
ncbi:hypothetical protein AB0N28_31315, partial [Streptomyces sp. NPDC051130]|uniref:hypothetical protein n=1 Tax=Streptomyces sp. NPDC051130 TaxID=3157223 RepID=UPI00343649C1